MSAKTLISNHFVADKKDNIIIPRKSRQVAGLAARGHAHIHTKEVILSQDNSRVEKLEKRTDDIHTKLSSKDIEIENLKSKLLSLENTNKSNKQSLSNDLLVKNEEIKELKAKLSKKSEDIDNLSNHAHTTSSLITSIHTDLVEKTDAIESVKSDLNDKVQQLNDAITHVSLQQQYQNLEQEKLKASTSTLAKPDSLHVGKDVNLPKQPEPVSEMGVWKVAPLALSVNGGMVLHDIGYTTSSKGTLPLVWDISSNRLLVNTSGK